jgi:IclR family acetate operon transcriptional repressor
MIFFMDLPPRGVVAPLRTLADASRRSRFDRPRTDARTAFKRYGSRRAFATSARYISLSEMPAPPEAGGLAGFVAEFRRQRTRAVATVAARGRALRAGPPPAGVTLAPVPGRRNNETQRFVHRNVNDMQDSDDLPASSTLRAFAVIELIANAEVPLSLDAITQRCRLPKPTVFRILGLLVRGGYVWRVPIEKRYAIGPRLSALALQVQMNFPERAQWHAVLVRLVDEIGETCNFTMQDGNQVVYLDRVETSSPVRLHMDTGSRVPLHCTASGKLFLSQLTPAQVRLLLGKAPLRRYTSRTITSLEILERELRKIRAEGVGTDVGEYLEGSVCLAVPVMDGRGRICAAVAVHGPAPRMSLRRSIQHLPALRGAAKALAATMAPWAGGAGAAHKYPRPKARPARAREAVREAW